MSEAKITKCKKCGSNIPYKTKPPTICSKCKTAKVAGKKQKTKRRFPKKRNTKGELYLFAILNSILKDHCYINHGYYSMLPSPKGSPLQLDRYYPELKLAFEYDGQQHESFNKFIHKTLDNYKYMMECDKLKDEYCKELGMTLIRVSYKHKITDEAIKVDIKKQNPELYKKLFGR